MAWRSLISGVHEQRPLLNSSVVVLQNSVDEPELTSVDSLWKGATNHERLRTTDLASMLRILLLVADCANHAKFVFSWPA